MYPHRATSIGTEPGNVATTPTTAVDPNPWPIPIVTRQSVRVAETRRTMRTAWLRSRRPRPEWGIRGPALGCRPVQIKLAVKRSASRAATMTCNRTGFLKLALAETKHWARCYGIDGRDAVLSRILDELVC